MGDKTVLIRAVVVRQQEKILTVRLQDGGGNAEVVVHQDAALPAPNAPTAAAA